MKNNLLRSLILSGCVLMSVLGLSACGGKNTVIDANEYIKYSLQGVNTQGVLTLSTEALTTAVEEAISETAKNGDNVQDLAKEAMKAIEFQAEPSSNLSNGDQVTVTAKIDNEKCAEEKIEFTFEEMTITINNLQVVPIYTDDDLFDMLTLKFDGISPDISVTLSVDCDDTHLANSLKFKIVNSKSSGHSNGDIITVEASADGSSPVKNLPFFLIDPDATLTRDYVVEGMPEYMSDAAQFTDEVLDTMLPVMTERIQYGIDIPYNGGMHFYFINSKGDMLYISPKTYTEPKLEKVLLLTLKEGVTYNLPHNRLYFIYSFDMTADGWNGFPHDLTEFDDVYYGSYISDVVVNADGTVDTPLFSSTQCTARCLQVYEEFYADQVKSANQSFDIVEVYSAE